MNLLLGDRATEGRILGRDLRCRLRRDRHRFPDLAGLERDVDALHDLGADVDVLNGCFLKAAEGGGDRVFAGRKRGNAVETLCAGGDLLRGSGVLVGNCNCDSAHHGAGSVRHRAFDRGVILRASHRCREKRDCQATKGRV